MARLPSTRYLMQEIGEFVLLFEDGSERPIARLYPSDSASVEAALDVIRDSELGDEDRSMAWFWVGYFTAYSTGELPRESFIEQMSDDSVVVATAEDFDQIVRFDPRDANAAARAQRAIYDSPLDLNQQARAHFWSGYFYARGSERF
jgi:hypothetical protein